MKRIILSLALLLLAAGGVGLAFYSPSGAAAESSSDPSEVQAFLDRAVLTDFEGNEYSLSDFEGKTLLLDFWETWCTPCLRTFPTLQKLMDDYPDDFLVLAISPGYMDTPEQVKQFVERNEYTFTWLFGAELSRELGIQSIPFKVYVGPDGQFVESSLGTRGPEQDYEKAKNIIERFL